MHAIAPRGWPGSAPGRSRTNKIAHKRQIATADLGIGGKFRKFESTIHYDVLNSSLGSLDLYTANWN